MQYIYLIPQKAVSVLKQRARWTKRTECIPHHQALELTAKAVGFDRWNQVVAAAEKCKPIEDAYLRGFLLAFDPSEVPDIEKEDFPFHWEPYAFDLLKDRLFDIYSSQIDEEDPDGRPIAETSGLLDLHEYFDADWSSMYFFRLKQAGGIATVEQLVALVSNYCFWPPRFVFYKGSLVDTYQQPELDAGARL